jgi:hypothetical protein
VRYSETKKDYRIFIPMQRKIVVSRDVKFKENLASRSTQESSAVTEEKEQQSTIQTSGGEEDLSPSSPIRRPSWILQTLKDVGEAPKSVVRERRPPKKFLNYMALMTNIIDVEPFIF